MVIIISMKNLKQRGGKFHFRMTVPKDCQDSVGKTEITQTLKTIDPVEAAATAQRLTDDWKQKFKQIRSTFTPAPPVISSNTDDTVIDFKKKLTAHMEQNLATYLEGQTEDELVVSSEWLMNCIAMIKHNDNASIDLSDELGVVYRPCLRSVTGVQMLTFNKSAL